MRAARLAETPHQGFVTRFQEDQAHGMLAAQLAIDRRELFDLLALARVNQKCGALHFSDPFNVQLAEHRNQRDRKVIDAVKTEIFKSIEDRSLAGTGEPRDDYKLPGVADFGRAIFAWAGALHGGGRA